MDWAEAIEFIAGLYRQYGENQLIDFYYQRVQLGHRSYDVLQSIEALKAMGYKASQPEAPKGE